ncbi:MAG: hypothetical protein IPP33_14655 [Flavobacteriales bacterium]|nr:hypothetical protein [Flavobacteriales bacterium]
MLRTFSFCCLLIVGFHARAQEQIGIAHSNYAGTDAVPLNPARMSGQWSWMDINIVGADLFVWNDHVYVNGQSRSVLGEMRESIRTSNSDHFIINESLDPGTRHVFVQASAKGPALALSLGKNSIGAHVSTRFALSLTGVGNDFARFAFNGLTYAPQHGIRYNDDGLRLVSAAWTEFGVSFARQLVARDYHRLSAGLTAKYLLGHGGAGFAFSELDYTVLDTARAVIHSASGEYGLAMPAMNAGSGFGFDLGISYERTLEEADGYIPHSSCDPLPYRYRLGFSLIDLGGLHFANALSGTFDASTAAFEDYTEVQANGEEGIDSLISASLSGFQRTQELSIGLPTAASLQFDYRVLDHVYVAASAVQNLSFGSALRLRRPNTMAIVPRFETQRFEVAVPITLYEYSIRRPGFGLMLRLNNLVVGSDNLMPLVSRSSLYGMDLYFRLKWTIFRSPICRGKKKAKHRAGDGNALPCDVPE